MARGWGRSEEDQQAEREQARAASAAPRARLSEQEKAAATRRRGLELSLARIAELLAHTHDPDRRRALESAAAELRERLGAERGESGGL